MKREDKFATITFWLVILIGPLFVGRWIYLAEQRTQKQEKARQVTKQQQIQKEKEQEKQEREQAKQELARKFESKIRELLISGAIHSVNVEFNEVRVDPLVWSLLPLENKQNFVVIFSQYFEAKGSTGRVNVLSNRNDQKLASYSVWSGVKIYY